MDWYYKAAIVVTLIWGAGRALGVYGEAARDLDLSFLISFMLTLGGWAAVFLIIDRVAKFLGWKRVAEDAPAGVTAAPEVTSERQEAPAIAHARVSAASKSTRTARRHRR